MHQRKGTSAKKVKAKPANGESVWEPIKFALALALVVGCLYINFYVLWPKL